MAQFSLKIARRKTLHDCRCQCYTASAHTDGNFTIGVYMFMRSFRFLPLLLLVCLALSACGGKQGAGNRTDSPSGDLEDIRRFPQDLRVYADLIGSETLLLDPAEQAVQDERFNRIFFGPWGMKKALSRRKNVAAVLNKARGFKYDDVRWTQVEWNAMSRNAQMGRFPSRKQAAITVRNTNLREVPTHETRFSEPTPDPKANPFDYFQYSLLPVGTPIFIVHTSRDGRWHFIECPVAGGWVDSKDVAVTDEAFMDTYRTNTMVALVRDNVSLPDANGGEMRAGIGTVLPLVAENAESLQALLPVKTANGRARITTISLTKDVAARKPLPMTAGRVAEVGNVMMGQRYGWGSMFGDRDCSSLTREILTPFGIWLPRNSASQARVGTSVSLEGLPIKEKEAIILREGRPFLSLLWMRGHIVLYVGKYKGRAAIFHNVWGVRVVDGANTNARHIIGRAVVTSITPGEELKNLYRITTFGERIRTMSTLPGDKQ